MANFGRARRRCDRATALALLCCVVDVLAAVACGRIGFVPRGDTSHSALVLDSGTGCEPDTDAGGYCTSASGGANARTTSASCVQPAVCGDGIKDPGEACDGGGRCNAQCMLVLPDSLVHRYSFDGTGTKVVD